MSDDRSDNNSIDFTDHANVKEAFDAYFDASSASPAAAAAAAAAATNRGHDDDARPHHSCAVPRYDALEIWLRRQCLRRLQTALTERSLTAVVEFWRAALQAVYKSVQFLESQRPGAVTTTTPGEQAAAAAAAAGRTSISATTSATTTDTEMTTAEEPLGIAQALLADLATMKDSIRKLPILLMEDILDTLDASLAFAFWSEVAIPSNDLLFGDLLWRNTLEPKKKPCWLVFLKASNKFLRRLQAEEMFEEASKVSRLLSMVYPLSEKSTMRGFGSHNTDHLAMLESEGDFEQQETASSPTPLSSTSSSSTSYSFYETFWKLQHDFRNPNAIVVVDFIRRLTTVLRSFQTHSLTTSPFAGHAGHVVLSKSPVMLRPYLTNGRILPIQLCDPAMRTLVLTQFWIVAEHLMPKVPALRGQLEPHVRTAETLMPADHLKLLKESSLFLRSEPQWKQWKQNKCLPDLDDARKPAAKPLAKRKLPDDAVSTMNASATGETEPASPLISVAKKMRNAAPLLRDHMEEYVDAIDPEAGIEAEYHPKNNAVYAWRALRLLSREHLDDFPYMQATGDFENMIRHVYAKKFDISIPGEPIPDAPDDDASQAAGGDHVDAADESIVPGNVSDAVMKDDSDGEAASNDGPPHSKTNGATASMPRNDESDAMMVEVSDTATIKMEPNDESRLEPMVESKVGPDSHNVGTKTKEMTKETTTETMVSNKISQDNNIATSQVATKANEPAAKSSAVETSVECKDDASDANSKVKMEVEAGNEQQIGTVNAKVENGPDDEERRHAKTDNGQSKSADGAEDRRVESHLGNKKQPLNEPSEGGNERSVKTESNVPPNKHALDQDAAHANRRNYDLDRSRNTGTAAAASGDFVNDGRRPNKRPHEDTFEPSRRDNDPPRRPTRGLAQDRRPAEINNNSNSVARQDHRPPRPPDDRSFRDDRPRGGGDSRPRGGDRPLWDNDRMPRDDRSRHDNNNNSNSMSNNSRVRHVDWQPPPADRRTAIDDERPGRHNDARPDSRAPSRGREEERPDIRAPSRPREEERPYQDNPRRGRSSRR